MKKDLCIDGKTFRFSGNVIKNSLWGHKNWPWGNNKVTELYEKPNGRTVVVTEESVKYEEFDCICSQIKEYLVPGNLKVECVS